MSLRARFAALQRRTHLFWSIVLIAAALCALRLALPYIVKDYVNGRLHRLDSYDGRVADIDIGLWRGAYRIDDGTGQLWVVSDRGVPRRNARVTVKGRVLDGFNLGVFGDRIKLPPGIEAGLVLMESSHKAKY